MRAQNNNIVIIGAGETAEMAYEYFTYDSRHKVAAFAVEKPFLKRGSLCGLPVVPLEELPRLYPAGRYKVFVAVSYTQRNQLRRRLFYDVKKKGYTAVSYISSRAFIWRNVEIGENCFILENNVIQHRAKIGNNVTLWSGNHIGHNSVIKGHTFVSSHVVVCGFCEIGQACFLGVNSTLVDKVKIGDNCIVGAAATVFCDVPDNHTISGVYRKNRRVKSNAMA